MASDDREHDSPAALLRRYLKSRFEQGDDGLFRTTAPLPSAAKPPMPAPAKPAWAPRPQSGGFAAPLPPRPATSMPAPRPVAAGGRSVAPSGNAGLHPSGILNPGNSEKGKALLAQWEKINGCLNCKLGAGRISFVYGTGNPETRIVFVGEAPGEQEDKQGLPFVGAAGKLLTDLLGTIGLTRDDIFICNVIKCRPPGNRKPEEDEIRSCEPHLFEQINIIKPKLVVALGTFAAQSLLDTVQPIGKLRGRWVRWREAELLATFHPSAGLRSSQFRKTIEEDFQILKAKVEKLGPA